MTGGILTIVMAVLYATGTVSGKALGIAIAVDAVPYLLLGIFMLFAMISKE